MNPRQPRRISIPFVSFILLLAALPVCASASVTFVQGEDIPLHGTSSGSTVVYLFLTGPNLPDGGISLIGGAPVITGASGSFTRVEVSTDGTWVFTWNTGDAGRVLSPGTYVIYIAQEPRARPDLGDTVFATRQVSFGRPVEAIPDASPVTTEPVLMGTMQGGPLVTGMEPASTPATPPGTTAPATPGRAALPALVPLWAVALLLWSCRWRR
jgi:hypothetical protein